MSKFQEEYYPLLQDEESIVCNTSPKFQRRFRCLSSGRARVQAKGAAYIITRWPDHLSTLLTYWWIGLGMIALLIFIIYNSIIAIAILPPAPIKPLNILNRHFNVPNSLHEKNAERNVYMHVFANSAEEMNIKGYLPYIETFSKKYTNFTFNFIVVINDVAKRTIEDYSDELKNELALDSLWNEKHITSNKSMQNNPIVQVISLSKYMDESPLKKYWRDLPAQFIGFLTRCIAIWDKGGIALNPIILTPKSPNPIYIERLEQILGGAKVYMNTPSSNKEIKKPKRKVNNIQDIINSLENGNNNHIDENMIEAENIQTSYISKMPNKHKHKRNTKLNAVKENNTSTVNYIRSEGTLKDLNKMKYENNSHHKSSNESYFKQLHTNVAEENSNNDVDKRKLLPMFLKYLFHENSNESLNNNSLREGENMRKNIGPPSQKKLITILENNSMNVEFGSNNFADRSQNIAEEINVQKNFRTNAAILTIDLNGNLIASSTPCHAFLGTIFSNVFHHTDEVSVKDFIITELSIFCKGTLSSCAGIDVILL